MNFLSPKVSICMPTYNRSDMLKLSIKSLLSQSFQNFELIVGDDASTDDTQEVVASFGDKRIQYFRNPSNQGQFNNTSQCLKRACGEYIIFFHDDDLMISDLLLKQVEVLDACPNVGVVAPSFFLIDKNGKMIGLISPGYSQAVRIFKGKEVFDHFLLGHQIKGARIVWIWPSLMMRKNIIEKFELFDIEMNTASDSLAFFKVLLLSDFAQITTPLYQYRYYDTSARGKPSASGDVFDEYFMRVIKSVNFAKENKIAIEEDYEQLALKHFARSMVSLNGAVTWVATRFDGRYWVRAKKLVSVFVKALRLNPCIYFYPKAYLILMGSIILPGKFIRKLIVLYFRWPILQGVKGKN